MPTIFTPDQIAAAQAAIDFYPDQTRFWDTPEGRDAINIAETLNLVWAPNDYRLTRYNASVSVADYIEPGYANLIFD